MEQNNIKYEIGIVKETIDETPVFISSFGKYIEIARVKLDNFSNINNIKFEIYFNHENLIFTLYSIENEDLIVRNLVNNFLTDLNKTMDEIKN